MNRYIVIIMVLFSCSSNRNQANQVSDNAAAKPAARIPALSAPSDPLLFRKLMDFPGAAIDETGDSAKQALIHCFPADFGGLKPAQIDSIVLQPGGPVLGEADNFLLYKITFSANAPSVVGNIQYLFVTKDGTKAALFPLSQLRPLQLGIRNNPLLFGGLFMLRGKGFYMIYRYDGKNGFRQIFDSSKDPDCGIVPVYNGSLDCICYDPFQLRLDLSDINGDKIKDLVFTGNVSYFCKGLELGYTREDRKPLKEKAIKIAYQTVLNGDSLSWQLKDTNVCRLLSPTIR